MTAKVVVYGRKASTFTATTTRQITSSQHFHNHHYVPDTVQQNDIMVPRIEGRDGANGPDEIKPESGLTTLASLR